MRMLLGKPRIHMVLTLLLVVGLCLVFYGAQASVFSTSAKYLEINTGPRAVGMGEANVAACDDVYALFWNPANLYLQSGQHISYLHNFWFQGINDVNLTYTQQMLQGGFGISLNYLDFGPIDRVEIAANGDPIISNQTYTPYALVLTSGYGTQVVPQVVLGGAIKLVSESIADFNNMTAALDLGCTYLDLLPGFNTGLVLQNAGLPMAGYVLPMTAKLGLAHTLSLGQNHLLTVCDINLPVTESQQVSVHVGAEFKYAKTIAARVGYKISELNALGAGAGVTAGLGVLYRNVTFDYAIAPFGDLGLSHRLALTYGIPAGQSRATKQKRKGLEKSEKMKRKKIKRPSALGIQHRSSTRVKKRVAPRRPTREISKRRGKYVRISEVAVHHAEDKSLIEQVTFDFEVTEDEVAFWYFKIFTKKGKLIREFAGEENPEQILWDGKDSLENPVPESARCSYILKAIMVNGESDRAKGPVVSRPLLLLPKE
jgi:type IX secretion system protein PorV